MTGKGLPLSFKNWRGYKFSKYSHTCVQRPPSGPEKSGRLTEVSEKTEIYTGR
jgi:hypothetical protein